MSSLLASSCFLTDFTTFPRRLSHHPEYVVPLFEFLTRGLSAKDVISAAAKAIRDVCEDCGALLLPALDALLKLFTQITPYVTRR